MSTKEIDKALAALRSVGANYKAPKIDFSGFDIYGDLYKRNYSSLPDIDWKGFAGNPNSSKDKKKDKTDFKPDLWEVLSGTLGQPGGAVTDTAHGYIQNVKDFGFGKDNKGDGEGFWKNLFDLSWEAQPKQIAKKAAKAGIKGQMDKWNDDKWTWGDVPGIGFLNGVDKGWKRGQDIAGDHIGLKGKKQVIAGIGIDILADPLTYLTGGASMATKAGKVKEAAKIAEIAKKYKIGKSIKNVDELIDGVKDILTKKYPNLSKAPELKYNPKSVSIIDKQLDTIRSQVKAARNQAYNAARNNYGMSIPFMNKATMTIGKYEAGGLFHHSEAVLGSQNKHLAETLIEQAAKGHAKNIPAIEKAVKNLYKVDDLGQLSKTMFSDLVKRLQPVIAKNTDALPTATTKSVLDMGTPKVDFDEMLKFMQKGKNGATDLGVYGTWGGKAEDVVQNLSKSGDETVSFDDLAADMHNSITDAKTAHLNPDGAKEIDELDSFKNFVPDKMPKVTDPFHKMASLNRHQDNFITKADEVFSRGDDAIRAAKSQRASLGALSKPFDEILDGTTGFEDWLRKRNPFDARTLKTGDKFVDSMGEHIADADSMRVGENAMYQKALIDIEKAIKKAGLTPEDMKKLIYFLEGDYPKGMSEADIPDKVKQVASLVKPLLDEVGTDDIAAGVLGKTRDNYFPHVVNKSQDEINQMMDFKAKREDPANLSGQQLGSKHDKSRTSFETIAQQENYIDDLGKKIAEATDDDEVQALTEQLQRVQGMFDTDVTSALTRRVKEGVRARSVKAMQTELGKYGMMVSNPEDVSKIKSLTKLSPTDAKKLGLGEGQHYMHPEVLKGLKRVDDIFTNEGMSKTVRHLNAISDIWRSLVTHYKPSHYRNNIIGNVITNMAAGVSVGDYKKAASLIKGYRNGSLTDAQMKLMKTAYSKNVVSGGFLTDASRSFKFQNPTKLEKIADKVVDNKGISKVRGAGEIADDITRLANFLGGMRKYGSTDMAAKQVRKYLFNYNELTNADRHMRTAVPFWNWIKRNTPLQAQLLLEQPQFAMNVERFKNLFNEGEDGEDWQKELGIKIPGMDYYTSLPSPTHDLNTLLNPQSIVGSMNPVPKMMLETMLNKKFFNNQPISYGSNTVQPEDLPEYFAKNFGITGNLYDAVSGKKDIGEALINLFNPVYGIRE